MSLDQFHWPVRVYYEDTDAGGVVYHSNYLNFMERARTEWLRALGFEQTVVKESLGVIIVVHSLSIAFKSPAYFNDLLEIHCNVAKIGRGSIELAQTITRNGVLLISAHVKAAFVNVATFKPVGIPPNIKEAMLQEFEHD
ncbi:MAG: tol-pal system-associated acyl-CoA thioesterase [Methylotenera sp.]|nr:tol-pal system-associated acyl-CoA thioesterase [Methylotenera sp.]